MKFLGLGPASIAGWLTVAEVWRQPTCPSTDEQTRKMWSVHADDLEMDEMKWTKIPTPATTQVGLERIMLSRISQLQRDKYCLILLTHGPWRSHVMVV